MHIRKCFSPLETAERNTPGKALKSKSAVLVACFQMSLS